MRGMRSNLVRERLRRFAAGHWGTPLEIVTYDVARANNALAVAIAHFVFGYTVRARVNGGTKEYRYPGFIEKEGVVWLGQSVFLPTPRRSREFRDFLASKGAAHEVLPVRVG